ncbi:MAG: ABC transporter permease [Cyclobacteriaceae bacterium]|nr:ABC transporter permease [Cyclobacteriaceae bacterium]
MAVDPPIENEYVMGGSNKNKPPAMAKWLVFNFTKDGLHEEFIGDLQEIYQGRIIARGKFHARLMYWIDVLHLLIGFSSINLFRDQINFTIMFKNYFTTAFRNITKHKAYSAINLAGLTLGLACSMLIFQYVTIEKGADSFHENIDKIYRVALQEELNGQTNEPFSQIFRGVGDVLMDEIPEVENLTRTYSHFFQQGPTISYLANDETRHTFRDISSLLVDTTFLSVFSFPLLAGDPATAVQQPGAILVTETMAQKLFGDEDPMGKIVHYTLGSINIDFTITGILKNTPDNSHIQFDVVVPQDIFLSMVPEERLSAWVWRIRNYSTYISVRENADIEKIENVLTDRLNLHINSNIENAITYKAVLQPMKSVYFDRETDLGMTVGGRTQSTYHTGNERTVYFLTVIGIITLAIAFISYTNLSTIRSIDRAREVGIRKVAGAGKSTLKWQFFFEASLMNVLALSLAALLLFMLLPTISSYLQINITPSSWLDRSFLMLFGGVFLLGVALSGWYPAFVLSSFKPIAALKGNNAGHSGKSTLRKVLIVLQYTPAIALLVCMSVVYQQLNFMRDRDIGLDMGTLITVRSPRILPDEMSSAEAEMALRNEIYTLSSVEHVTYAGNQAGRGLNFQRQFQVDSAGQFGILDVLGTGIDHEFIDVYGLELLAGTAFREGDMTARRNTDPNWARNVLVNETMVRKCGFKNNEDAIGHIIKPLDAGRSYKIQGVLEDFNWSSLHQETQPVILWYKPENAFLTVKLSSADIADPIAQIKSIYNRLFPDEVFLYEMTDAVFKEQYREDEQFANLFGIFSLVGIFIASLGLYGLSAFTTARRSKEVGIRKVLGSSVNSVVGLLSKDFLLLVLLAFLLACPIAWFTMSSWLDNFAFKTELTFIPFITAGFGAILIAAITVSWKAYKAATVNPVDVLKNE